MIVPKNKTVYFGSRKWVEGEMIPPHIPVIIQKPIEENIISKAEIPEILKEVEEEKPKRRGPGRPRKEDLN